jgi:hypothetical protein
LLVAGFCCGQLEEITLLYYVSKKDLERIRQGCIGMTFVRTEKFTKRYPVTSQFVRAKRRARPIKVLIFRYATFFWYGKLKNEKIKYRG